MKKQVEVRWIFNSLMIWGAVLGFLIFGGVGEIRDTWRHQGPGVIWYEDDSEQVSEKEYKRHHYTMGGFGLILGLAVWITIAKKAKKDAVEIAANKNYLDAKIQTKDAYHAAFAKVMGVDAYQSAAAEALKDPAYQAAITTLKANVIVYRVAAKAAKGDA